MSTQQTNPAPESIDGGMAIVSGPKGLQLTTLQKVGVAGLAAAVFLAFIWVDYLLSRKEGGKQAEQLVVEPNRAAFRSPPSNLPPGPAPMIADGAGVPASPAVPSLVPGAPGAPSAGEQAVPSGDSAIFAYSGGGASASAPDTPSPDRASRANEAEPAAAAAPKDTVGKARLLRRPDLLLTKGTIIPCTLQTAINTELAGFAKCVLPEAVRGTTGNVVLLDRGTTIVGEIQTSHSAGQKRVFIQWDRVETPAHVVVSLASPGADELGRTGVPGAVDSHFRERFGNAMLLSLLQGSLQIGAAAAGSGSGGGNFVGSFQSNGDQLANSAVQSNTNIPSTIEKGQGGNISIFVAQDIDFSDVYSLRRIR